MIKKTINKNQNKQIIKMKQNFNKHNKYKMKTNLKQYKENKNHFNN